MECKTVVEYLFQHAKEYPGKTAIIANGIVADYRRLADLVCRYAAFLQKNGLQKNDVIVVKSSQTLDYVVAYFAVHAAGGVAASVEKNMPEAGILAVAKSVGAKMIISVGGGKELPCEDTVRIDSAFVLADAQNTQPKTLSLPDAEDSADILLTTGTTGSSKGVELDHKTLVATARRLIYGGEYRDNTVLVVPSPLNHALPIAELQATIVNGSTMHILNGMTNLKAFYDALEDDEGSLACSLPPAMVRMLFTLSGDTIGRHAEKIDFIESGGAPFPETDKLRLCKLLPKSRLYNVYGSAESAITCMYDYNANPGKIGCVGKAMPHSQVIIVDDDKKVIQSSADHVGYLACLGDTNMKGYINDPEQTKQVLADGIVYTNDIGYIDAEGFVYVIGRKDDVINVGGLKVAPAEVEAAALSIEGIKDCICVPMRHPISGYAPKLLVVMREDAEFSVQKITSELQQRLEGYKVPTQYEKVESVARTYNGKLDRKAYRF